MVNAFATKKDVVIIGGGPAGLAAAVRLHEAGIRDILILEREKDLGGILRQCIHDGFGLTRFRESLSGPEYAARFIREVEARKIPYITEAMVLELSPDRRVTASTRDGILEFEAGAVVLAMGCRERTRGAISIPGDRPAGVYTAGIAQAYINLHNTMVGKEVVILGSGDIGLIMARRLTLEGAHVQAVFEILPHPSGLPRNLQQCLEDFDIPLHLSHTVTRIKGASRLEGVTVARVDGRMEPIPGTERELACDTLILSVGLIPENELSLQAGVALDPRTRGPVVDEHFQTSAPGIFAAGNVLQVHDLVDFVSMEAESLAASVARFVREGSLADSGVDAGVEVRRGAEVSYTVPQKISGTEDFVLSLRVARPRSACRVNVTCAGTTVATLRMRKAVPAEMIRIPVKASALRKALAAARDAARDPIKDTAPALEVAVEC